jgi:hypothetical protein
MPRFTPRKIPGTHFCLRLSRPQDHSAAGKIRTSELVAYSIVPQPIMLPRARRGEIDAKLFGNEVRGDELDWVRSVLGLQIQIALLCDMSRSFHEDSTCEGCSHRIINVAWFNRLSTENRYE